MSICGRNYARAKGSGAQTTRDDFCEIFTQEVKGLYLLSFLLTANHKLAEQCFAAGMEDCVEGNPVFRAWARAWSRRAIIKDAIRMVSPLAPQTDVGEPAFNAAEWGSDVRPVLAAVMQLEPLERFVYVMSVIERYSDHECSTFLTTTKERVAAARTRALQHLSICEWINSRPEDLVGQLLSTETENLHSFVKFSPNRGVEA